MVGKTRVIRVLGKGWRNKGNEVHKGNNIKYKHMKNQRLIDRRFSQIEGKIKTLKFLLSRNSKKEDFVVEINQMEELVNDLKAVIERESTPLRNG